MISAARREASRANGRRSRGPKTAEGKARSSRNAVRHGLSRPAGLDPACAQQIASLARAVAGADAGRERFAMACRIAAAQVEVARARLARAEIFSVTRLDDATLARAQATHRYEQARLRSASAPSGSSMPPLRSHRIHLTEILPRPQRYTIWLCGEATVLMAAVAIRPACLVCQTLMRTLTPNWIKSFGGSPAFSGTRSRAIWNILAERAQGVPAAAAKFRRTNPRRRNPTHAISAKRTRGSPSKPTRSAKAPRSAKTRCRRGRTNPSDRYEWPRESFGETNRRRSRLRASSPNEPDAVPPRRCHFGRTNPRSCEQP